MTDHHDPGSRRDRDEYYDLPADPRRDYDWRASQPAGGRPRQEIRRLSEAEEQDLHFNGYPFYGMQPLHELCRQGFCRYKTEAQNLADLKDWYAWATLTLESDPEAEL